MKEGQEPAKAVVKTMSLLECLSSDGSLGVTELAKATGMHKSTTYRFLATLKELGYVRQDPDTERYGLTLRLFELGTSVHDRMELWTEAEPVMKRIGQSTGETIHLAVLDDSKLVYLGKTESTQTLRVSMMSRIGRSAPTYCTGVGKILLAHLPPGRVSAILRSEKMVRYTERTIVSRSELDRELEAIRDNGYAIDNEEHEIGVRCVAAPVHDNDGEVVAALSISMPSVRLTDREVPKYRNLVIQAASEISERLGYRNSRKSGR